MLTTSGPVNAHLKPALGMFCPCRNRYNSKIVLCKVGIVTLMGDVRIPTWCGSIQELSLRKVGMGTK